MINATMAGSGRITNIVPQYKSLYFKHHYLSVTSSQLRKMGFACISILFKCLGMEIAEVDYSVLLVLLVLLSAGEDDL